ncbi:hypothetical protein, partial [uncultured Sulfitobacter sp.]|uniref:hypothetical protein n=1 Tax=uncultured Sulfitobacter sp. TaxID=191468 RepID=UPI00263376A8
ALEAFAPDVPIGTRREEAVARSRAALDRVKRSHPRIAVEGFACYGRTRNNLREFDFFQDLCASLDIRLDKANYAFAETARVARPDDLHEAAAAQIADMTAQFYAARDRITAGVVRQCNIYITMFQTFLTGFTAPGAVWPVALVLANDHSPAHVALSMVAKGLGIPRIYLQHAEISPIFPRLDFEYSVLRNERSRTLYASLGDIPTGTMVLPRAINMPDTTALSTPLPDPVDVVVYPTASVLEAPTEALLRGLCANPGVARVAIKDHPNAARKIATWLEVDGVVHLDAIPETPHLAIVGSSSIAIELVAAGHQVHQVFGFDPVPPDYYGFVAAGLMPELEPERASEKFWAPYEIDNAWLSEYGQWIPINPETERKKAFVEQMARLRDNHVSRRVPAAPVAAPAPARPPRTREHNAVDLVAFTLATSKTPREWLQLNQKLNQFQPIVVVHAVNRLISQRDPVVAALFASDPGLNPASNTQVWFTLKRAERLGLVVTEKQIDTALDRIESSVRGRMLRREIEKTLMPAVIDYGTDAQVARFAKLRVNPWRWVNPVLQFGLLQRLAPIENSRELYDRLRAGVEEDATPFARLRYRNVEFFAGAARDGWSHETAECDFAETAPEAVRRQFTAEVQPIYERLRSRMTLMDLHLAPQRDEFRGLLRASLENGRGFSCIRLSDGEGALFPEAGYCDEADLANRERHWWGTELPEEDRLRIRAEVHAALSEADVVGIPSIYRFVRDTAEKSKSLTSAIQGRGLLSALHAVEEHVSATARFTEDKCNDRLFKEINTITDLLPEGSRVTIVSSVRPEHLPPGLRNLPGLEHVALTTHNNVKGNDIYVQGDRPLPFVYRDLMDEFDAKTGPGRLVLVAGGIVGKIFIGRARRRGAVAMDIGHVMDGWVRPRHSVLR